MQMNSLIGFDKIKQFEDALAEYTGAPYVVMTDCCTHAIEMCLRYELKNKKDKVVSFTAHTYLSVPMTFHKLGISYDFIDEQWVGEYQFLNTKIWDSARRFEPNMYRPGMMQCLSFGHTKPLHIGRGGAILLDDKAAYEALILMRYDGRDLNIRPWESQQTFKVGYHYKPTPEEAVQGLALLEGLKEIPVKPEFYEYPDLRTITITD